MSCIQQAVHTRRPRSLTVPLVIERFPNALPKWAAVLTEQVHGHDPTLWDRTHRQLPSLNGSVRRPSQNPRAFYPGARRPKSQDGGREQAFAPDTGRRIPRSPQIPSKPAQTGQTATAPLHSLQRDCPLLNEQPRRRSRALESRGGRQQPQPEGGFRVPRHDAVDHECHTLGRLQQGDGIAHRRRRRPGGGGCPG